MFRARKHARLGVPVKRKFSKAEEILILRKGTERMKLFIDEVTSPVNPVQGLSVDLGHGEAGPVPDTPSSLAP